MKAIVRLSEAEAFRRGLDDMHVEVELTASSLSQEDRELVTRHLWEGDEGKFLTYLDKGEPSYPLDGNGDNIVCVTDDTPEAVLEALREAAAEVAASA